jgi:hypothetical protein
VVSKLVDTRSAVDHAVPEVTFKRCPEPRRYPLLQAEIIRRQFAATSPIEYVALQYQTVMCTGQASVTDIRNVDYPAIVPTSVAVYLPGPGAAHLTAANPRLG